MYLSELLKDEGKITVFLKEDDHPSQMFTYVLLKVFKFAFLFHFRFPSPLPSASKESWI